MILLHEYFNAYIPHNGTTYSDSSNGSDVDRSLLRGEAALLSSSSSSWSIQLSSSSSSSSSSSIDYASNYKRQQELFLRLIIEYWIDTTTIVHVDHHKVGLFKRLYTTMDLNHINPQGRLVDVGVGR
jgi:hypothetical protein